MGVCSHPIPACQPALTMQDRRARVVLLAVATSLGIIVAVLSTPGMRTAFIMPGDLSFAHGTLAEAGSGHDCAKCHAHSDSAWDNWLTHGLVSTNEQSVSVLCLSCHEFGERQYALNAHGASDEKLKKLTSNQLESFSPDHWQRETSASFWLSAARVVGVGSHLGSDDVACTTCHVEHHGREHDLTRMSNAQCQVCHATAFKSLHDGHTNDFTSYAFERRTHLKFDHISHIRNHFGDKDTTCDTCHRLHSNGRHMVLNDFELSCKECHLSTHIIPQKGQQGVLVLGLPRFAERNNGEQPADEWPVELDWTADADTVGRLTPFMMLLLAGGDDYESGANLKKDIEEWLRLDEGDREDDELSDDDRAVIARLANAVLRLFEDLRERGGITARLVRALEPIAASADVDSLLGGLEDAVEIRKGAIAWLTPEAGGEKASETETRSWYLDNDVWVIGYRPTEHRDPFLQAWLDLTAPNADQRPENLLQLALSKIFWELGRDYSGKSPSNKEEYGSPGACLMCHMERNDTAEHHRSIVWGPPQIADREDQWTRFSHAPHVSITDCQGCHTKNECYQDRTQFQSMYRHPSQQVAISANPRQGEDDACQGSNWNFAPIRKDKCVTCHVSDRAGDGCLQCHVYHVDPRDLSKTKQATSLDKFVAELAKSEVQDE